MKAVRFKQFGGPEILEIVASNVRVRHAGSDCPVDPLSAAELMHPTKRDPTRRVATRDTHLDAPFTLLTIFLS
jgi:hypothetical protein